MREELLDHIHQAVGKLLAESSESGEPPEFGLETPRQKDHGDFACNAALLLAKRLRKPPRALAERLQSLLGDAGGLIDRSEIAGPGFLNIWLAGGGWQDLLRSILAAGEAYGRSSHGAERRIQVEFVSCNPTGPLSTGHGRQGVLGDCIARLLEFTGYDVVREYYFNNGGRQMRVLGESVKARYLEALGLAAPPPVEAFEAPESDWPDEVDGLPVRFPRDGYRGAYISEIAEGIRVLHGEESVDEPASGLFREVAEEEIFGAIRRTLGRLAIHFDVYFNEKSLYDEGRLDEVLADLRERGRIYEFEGATWLRAIDSGLDRDRVLIRSNGEPTYLLPDLAYHRNKLERKFDIVIDVLGADHIDQFPYVRLAVGHLGYDPEQIELVMHQFVTISSAGKSVKQSTRKANFITVDELLDEVGVDVFRFFMVQRKADGHLDFDLDLAKDTNWRKNPAFYVQYAHARTYGIERTASEAGMSLPGPKEFDASCLDLPEELELVKKLAEFPALVLRAAETREPHHIAYYLRDVAGLWNPYIQDGRRHRIVSEDAALTRARLALALGVRIVLANGLRILGLSAPERM